MLVSFKHRGEIEGGWLKSAMTNTCPKGKHNNTFEDHRDLILKALNDPLFRPFFNE
jgi:hypothetical protein